MRVKAQKQIEAWIGARRAQDSDIKFSIATLADAVDLGKTSCYAPLANLTARKWVRYIGREMPGGRIYQIIPANAPAQAGPSTLPPKRVVHRQPKQLGAAQVKREGAAVKYDAGAKAMSGNGDASDILLTIPVGANGTITCTMEEAHTLYNRLHAVFREAP
jgi:hypothetical protein